MKKLFIFACVLGLVSLTSCAPSIYLYEGADEVTAFVNDSVVAHGWFPFSQHVKSRSEVPAYTPAEYIPISDGETTDWYRLPQDAVVRVKTQRHDVTYRKLSGRELYSY